MSTHERRGARTKKRATKASTRRRKPAPTGEQELVPEADAIPEAEAAERDSGEPLEEPASEEAIADDEARVPDVERAMLDDIPDELRDLLGDEEPPIPGADSELGPGLEKTRPVSVSEAHLKSVLESLIFVTDKPVPARRLARIARARTAEVERLVRELMLEYEGRGIELVEVAGGFQFRSSAANAPFVREIVLAKPVRLSRAQLETLAIAAYRQPLTRPELEEIRGVDSGSALKTLLERGLVKILGRKDEPGRPLLYGTTPQFLELFGMSSLEQLPTLKEFTELSDESRVLFARKTGEEIESIGDIEVPETSWEGEDEVDETPSDLGDEAPEAQTAQGVVSGDDVDGATLEADDDDADDDDDDDDADEDADEDADDEDDDDEDDEDDDDEDDEDDDEDDDDDE